MKALLCGLFLFSSFFCFSQDSTSKFLLGVSAALNRSELRFDDSEATSRSIASSNNEYFKAGVGSGWTARVDMNLGKKLWLNTGLGWDTFNFVTDTLEEVRAAEVKYRVQVLTLPAAVSFHFLQRSKFSMYSGMGVRMHLITGFKSRYQLIGLNDGSDWTTVSDASNFIFSGCAHFGMRWKLDSKWMADFGIYYSYGLNDVLTSTMKARVIGQSASLSLLRNF